MYMQQRADVAPAIQPTAVRPTAVTEARVALVGLSVSPLGSEAGALAGADDGAVGGAVECGHVEVHSRALRVLLASIDSLPRAVVRMVISLDGAHEDSCRVAHVWCALEGPVNTDIAFLEGCEAIDKACPSL